MMKPQGQAKKELERAQLDRFRCVFPEFPAGRIIETENPDFIVAADGRSVGIEVTELYWNRPSGKSPMQEQEALRRQIALEACRRYISRGLPAVHVSIHFNGLYPLSKGQVKDIASQVEAVVSSNVPEPNAMYEESFDWENREYFPEEVDSLSVWNMPVMEAPFFSAPVAAFIPDLSRSDMVRTIQSKEPKLSRYRERCAEVWLLILSNGSKISTLFGGAEGVLADPYFSNFDRIFLLQQLEGKVHELKLSVGPESKEHNFSE
jgi:hypothetical protein